MHFQSGVVSVAALAAVVAWVGVIAPLAAGAELQDPTRGQDRGTLKTAASERIFGFGLTGYNGYNGYNGYGWRPSYPVYYGNRYNGFGCNGYNCYGGSGYGTGYGGYPNAGGVGYGGYGGYGGTTEIGYGVTGGGGYPGAYPGVYPGGYAGYGGIAYRSSAGGQQPVRFQGKRSNSEAEDMESRT